MTKKIMFGMVAIIMMVSMMGTMKASAESNKAAQEFKEDLIERFDWESWSPCQAEMMNWLYDEGFDDGVQERISRVPITAKWNSRTIEYSVVFYFINKEESTAKRIDFYITTDGEFVNCNWNNAYGLNKRVEPYDRMYPVMWFE